MAIPSLPYEALPPTAPLRVVDVRTPKEFARDHIPGAVNLPLFDDQQRVVIGTLYKQESPARALEHGLELAEAALPGLLSRLLGETIPEPVWRARFRELAIALRGEAPPELALARVEAVALTEVPEKAVVVHCWRGGMRSRSIVALLRALGHDRVFHLQGGYKAYRRQVIDGLAGFDSGTPLILLRGPTGIGKTRILQALEDARPGTTLDLEGLARHRSSILGDVGLEPVSAPAFESALLARLDRLGPPPWFVEGESRKVGDIVLPEPIYRAMESGCQVRLDARLGHRVRLLCEDYLADERHYRELLERLPFLEERLGPEWKGRLQAWLRAGESERVAEVLLQNYYDMRYARSDRRRRWRARFDAEDPELIPKLLSLRDELRSRPLQLANPA